MVARIIVGNDALTKPKMFWLDWNSNGVMQTDSEFIFITSYIYRVGEKKTPFGPRSSRGRKASRNCWRQNLEEQGLGLNERLYAP